MCEEMLNSEFLVVMAAVQRKLSLNFLNRDINGQMRLLTVRCTNIRSKIQSNTTTTDFVRN